MMEIQEYRCIEGEIDVTTLSDIMKDDYEEEVKRTASELKTLILARRPSCDDDESAKSKKNKKNKKKKKKEKAKENNTPTPIREEKAATTLSTLKELCSEEADSEDKHEEDEKEKIEEKEKETVEKEEDNSGACAESETIKEKTEENKGETEERKKNEKEGEELQVDKKDEDEVEGVEEDEDNMKEVQKQLDFSRNEQNARDAELTKKVDVIYEAIKNSKMDTDKFFLQDQYFDDCNGNEVGPVTALLKGVHHLEPDDTDCQHEHLFNENDEAFFLLKEYCGALPELFPNNLMAWGSDEHSSGCSSKIVLHREDWIEIPSFLDPDSSETPKLKADIQALDRKKKKLVLDLDTLPEERVIFYL